MGINITFCIIAMNAETSSTMDRRSYTLTLEGSAGDSKLRFTIPVTAEEFYSVALGDEYRIMPVHKVKKETKKADLPEGFQGILKDAMPDYSHEPWNVPPKASWTAKKSLYDEEDDD